MTASLTPLYPRAPKNVTRHHGNAQSWRGSFYRKRAAKLGPYVEEILSVAHTGNGFIDTRKVWGILALDKKYSADNINNACQKALSVDAISYRSILTFLQLKTTGQQEENKGGVTEDIKKAPNS